MLRSRNRSHGIENIKHVVHRTLFRVNFDVARNQSEDGDKNGGNEGSEPVTDDYGPFLMRGKSSDADVADYGMQAIPTPQ